MNPSRHLWALALVVALTGCGSGDAATPTSAKATNKPTSTATARDIMGIPHFDPLEPGTYYIDPDGDRSTPLRVAYRIAAHGWLQGIGALKRQAGA